MSRSLDFDIISSNDLDPGTIDCFRVARCVGVVVFIPAGTLGTSAINGEIRNGPICLGVAIFGNPCWGKLPVVNCGNFLSPRASLSAITLVTVVDFLPAPLIPPESQLP